MEKIEGLSIALDLNTIKVDTGLKDLKSKLSLVNSEMKANMSAFDRSDQSIGKYQTRLDGLNKKLEVQREVTDKAKKSYEKMVAEHGEGSVEAEKAARSFNEESAKLNNLSRYVENATAELAKMKEQQRIAGSGWTKIGDSMTKFGTGLKSISAKTRDVGRSLTSKITKPALGAATALGGIALAKGFGRLVGIDNAKAKLKGLGHDANNVQKIMDSALESVKGTSYGMDEAATTAASAVAAGIKPGKELTKYLSLTGDAAAIAGTSMSEMGSIINQVQTSQVAYTDNLNQLADRGIPIYQWLGEEAGVAAGDVKKMASEGSISSEMFLSAIEKNIGGAAKKMGQESFTAGLANMWSAVGRLGASFLDAGGKGGGFFSKLKPLIADFTDRIDDMGAYAEKAGEKFGEAFTSIVEKVKSIKAAYDGLSPTIQNIIKKIALVGSVMAITLGPILTGLGLFGGFVAKISTGLGTLASGIAKFGGLAKILGSVFTAITGPIGITVGIIAALTAGLVIAYKKSEIFRNIVNGLRDAFLNVVSGIKKFLTTNETVLAIVDQLKENFEVTKQLLGLLVDAFVIGFKLIVKGAQLVIKALVWIVDGVKKLLEANSIVQAFVDQLKRNFEFLTGFIKNSIDTTLGYFRAFTDFLKEIIKGWKAIFSGDFKEGLGIMIDAAKNLFIDLYTNFKEGFSRLGGLLKDWAKGTVEPFINAKDKIVEALSNWTSAIGDWFSREYSEMAVRLGRLGSVTVQWFKDMPGNIKDAMKDWAKAVAEKFDDIKQAAKDKLKDWGKSFTGWFDEKRTMIGDKLSSWSKTITDWFDNMPENIYKSLKRWTKTMKTWTEDQNEKNKEYFGGWKDTIVEWFSSMPMRIKKSMSSWKEAVSDRFKETKKSISDRMDEWWTTISDWFTSTPKKIKEKMSSWKSTISERFKDIKKTISDRLEEWWTSISNWFTSVPEKIRNKLTAWKKAISDKFIEIKGTISERLTEWWQTLSKWFADLPGKTKSSLINFKDTVKNSFDNAKKGISEALENWWQTIKGWFASAPEKTEVKNAGKNIVKKVASGTSDEKEKKNFMDKLGKVIIDVILGALALTAVALVAAGREILKRVGEGLKEGKVFVSEQMEKIRKLISDKMREAKDAAIKRVTEMIAPITNKLKILRTNMSDAYEKIRKKTADVFSNVYKTVKGKFDDIVQAAKNLPGRIGKGISKFAHKVGDGINDLKKTMTDKLRDALNGVIGGINWVLNLLNIDGIEPWDGKSKGKAKVEKHAKGTDNHPGGPAILGDGRGSNAGPELVALPNGRAFLSAPTDTLYPYLPKGTSVLSAKKTRALFDGLPQYAKGKGWLEKTADAIKKPLGILGKEQIRQSEVQEKMAQDVWEKSGKWLLNKALKTLKISKPGDKTFAEKMAGAGWDKVKPGGASYIEQARDGIAPLTGGISFGGSFRRTSGFGPRWGTMHKGVDYAAPVGTPIKAQAAGTVIFSGFGRRGSGYGGYGNVVHIQGPGGYSYLYAHNSRNLVQAGQPVSRGQVIGLVGSTGHSTGPHVHFEIRKNGTAIDPEKAMTGGGVSGTSGKLRKWVAAGMQRAGVSGKAWADGLSWIAQKESSGNPLAVGAMTSTGTAKGLMQLKDFNIVGNPFDPVNNVFHGIKYIKKRYGTIGKAVDFWKKNGWYKTGGWINTPGLYGLADGGWPEWVIPTDPSRRTDAMKLLALAGKDIERNSNKRPHQLPSIGTNDSQQDNSRLEKMVELLSEQVMLLTQLVAKDQNVYIDGKQAGKLLEPHISQTQEKRQISKLRARGIQTT